MYKNFYPSVSKQTPQFPPSISKNRTWNVYKKRFVFTVLVLFLELCIIPSTIGIEETAPLLNDDVPLEECYMLNVTIIP